MSVVSLKGVRMMKDKNYSTKGALRSISAARIRGPVLTCQRWPWLPARQMKGATVLFRKQKRRLHDGSGATGLSGVFQLVPCLGEIVCRQRQGARVICVGIHERGYPLDSATLKKPYLQSASTGQTNGCAEGEGAGTLYGRYSWCCACRPSAIRRRRAWQYGSMADGCFSTLR